MAALLIDVKKGDEIILPSYTFVSTANAFVLRGATLVFTDSSKQNPNISVRDIEKRITKKTKAIVVVHYAGISCDMDAVMRLASSHRLFVIEDAAQAIDSYYKKRPLGSIGHLATFSFHETKNIISGEGGMLVINDERFVKRAEIIWEKGTNRNAFFRGEVDKYSWVDIGSSFLPSEITAAFLWAQLEKISTIQKRRKQLWNKYREQLQILENRNLVGLPFIPAHSTNNAHVFYLLTKSHAEQIALLDYLRLLGIQAIFHYLPLHLSPYFSRKEKGGSLPNCERFGERLIRLPLYFELTMTQIKEITMAIKRFYGVRT
jgi:dTDP-4-amino-4,6-dideoxygalactose transaminase